MPDNARAICNSAPYDIQWVGGYWDGGTVGFVVTDSVGCQIEGCFARTVVSSAEDSGRLFLGARHPDDEYARIASAVEDSLVVNVLKLALRKTYPKLYWSGAENMFRSETKARLPDEECWLLLRCLTAHLGSVTVGTDPGD